MITEDYVSFETAKLLKEKGFDSESITAYYFFIEGSEPILNRIEPQHFINLCGGNISLVGCPTLQMAMKWLRKEHNIHIVPMIENNGNYICYLYDTKGNNIQGWDKRLSKTSYEEACEVAIKYCLEKLCIWI